MKTWSTKKRLSVILLKFLPARMRWASQSPMNGARPACSAPTMTVQTAFWSQRRVWPVKPMPTVNRSRTKPLTQLISRGNRYEAVRKTRIRWNPTKRIMAEAPQ